MCGISGVIWNDDKMQVSSETLARMTNALQHRGPDDDGFYRTEINLKSPYGEMPGIGLGFRRLSIIDVSGGHQPISNEDDSIWMVFNGEIYNDPELRKRLEGSGHQYKTRCDSETIIHLYEDEGEECFRWLNGMFAIAIWDSKQKKLVIARDRFGQKPLVYCEQAGRLSFASELKSLMEIPDVPREVDANAIDEYLAYQYVPYPNTIYRGIRKLPPGHLGVWKDGSFATRPYWELDYQERPTSLMQSVEELQHLMDSSVSLRMRSDVPLGAFLSGGVDSSLIVALMQAHSDRPIKTFSIGFPVAEYNETDFAKQVANHLGTDHHVFEVTPDAVEILPALVEQYDEPFADSSAIPTWYVSKMTRDHVTVALSGDGGDELFAGYPRYRAVRLGSWIDRLPPIRSLLGLGMWQKLPGQARQKGLLRRAKRFSEAVRQEPLRRYLEWIGIFNESRRAELYRTDFLADLVESDPYQFLKQVQDRIKNRDAVTRVSMIDLSTYLPCDLMTKVDMASMGNSLEVRQPFLDYRVAQFAASLPVRFKMKGMNGKWLLRRAFEKHLPESIWTRKKMGFGVPLDHWFRNELRPMTEEILLDPECRCLRFFQPESIAQLNSEHQNKTFDHSYRLWSLLMLELWLRRWQ